MKPIGIFYGSTTGNTKKIAEKIKANLEPGLIDIYDVKYVKTSDVEKYDNIILGASTWGEGILQADFERFLYDVLKFSDLKGKRIAIFGTGDSAEYPESFADSIGIIFEALEGKGAIFVGDFPTQGFEFVSEIGPEQIPEKYIPAIEQGARETLDSGYLKGYPVVDVKVILTGGSFDESKSSELAFSVCGSMACKNALHDASISLLEPIMDVELFVPEAFMGDAIADLNARGGKVESINPKADIQIIKAIVPLRKMFGYSTALRSATQGRGTFTMQFASFDKV